jgi:hypothetical protein
MVVVGVAFELGVIFCDFREDLHAFRRATIQSPERPSVNKLIFEVFACALVVVGVAGEFFVARATEDLGTELRIISNERVEIATKEAGDANQHAEEANERSRKLEASNGQLGIDLETEKQKTARFEKAASDSQLALDKQLRIQGPRWRLLGEAAPALSLEMQQFGDQRADIVLCGRSDRIDNETSRTAEMLAGSILGDKGAKWNINWHWDAACIRFPVVIVFVNSTAKEQTRLAASALSKGLNEILKPYSSGVAIPVDPQKARILFGNTEAPGAVALNNPDSVVISIGAHP